MCCSLVRSAPPSYAVSVRRLGTLPAASFRFHLAVDTLAVRLALPTTKRAVDFHYQAIAHGGRTTKKQDRVMRSCIGFRRRPTLPGRVQPSTIGAEGLNFCVRNGNRWDPFAIVTGNVIFSMGPTLKRLPDTLSSVFLKPHCVLCGSILSCTRSRLRIFTTAHCFL